MTDSIATSDSSLSVGKGSAISVKSGRRPRFAGTLAPYLPAPPLAVILVVFLLVPIVTIVIVSFWDYDFARIIPSFILTNYKEALASAVTWRTYLNTIRYAAIVWALTALIGFTVAYFLAF